MVTIVKNSPFSSKLNIDILGEKSQKALKQLNVPESEVAIVLDSNKKLKPLLKEKKKLSKANMTPGNIIFTSYDAKDKTVIYDKNPFLLILRRNRRHTLGLNFHWLPFPMRIRLIKEIISLNKSNIERNRPLEFKYKQLKPMLKSLGYAPCIRLYINKRFGEKGVVISPSRMLEVARLRAESFTGRSAEELYHKAAKKVKPRIRLKTTSSSKGVKPRIRLKTK